MKAFVMIERPGRASPGIALATLIVGGLSGWWLGHLVAGGSLAQGLALGFVVASSLLAGWANAASP